MEYTIPLFQTKLQRSVQSIDPVSRPRLSDWLDQRWKRPLKLVSTPAGYGKSTMISRWLDHCDYPSTWLTMVADRDVTFVVIRRIEEHAPETTQASGPWRRYSR